MFIARKGVPREKSSLPKLKLFLRSNSVGISALSLSDNSVPNAPDNIETTKNTERSIGSQLIMVVLVNKVSWHRSFWLVR